MRVERVSVIVLVQQMDRAVRFYRDTLGLTVAEEEEDWVSFVEGFGLMLAPDIDAQDNLRLNAVLLCLTVQSVDAEYGRLIERAVPFLVAPTDTGFGRAATFQDSEGNLVQIVQARNG